MSARVKICGIRTAEAMAAALEARADLVGLVFFPPSPRNVSIEDAVPLADFARGYAAIVALVVDADDALLGAIMAAVNPDMLQLHGNETPARVAEIRERFGKPVMKAIKVETAADARAALAYRDAADLVLFDAKPPKGADRPGGHGVAFDWNVIADLKGQVPFMLGGGLGPGNVGEAIRITGATVVDVSSGVESAPGVKDPELIRAFVAAAKGAPA
jgi:phosphoribosylanthranilate isomerase